MKQNESNHERWITRETLAQATNYRPAMLKKIAPQTLPFRETGNEREYQLADCLAFMRRSGMAATDEELIAILDRAEGPLSQRAA